MPSTSSTSTATLSPGFQAVLDQRNQVNAQMDGTQLVIAALCVLLAVRARRPVVACLSVTALCVVSVIAAGAHLDHWWQSLNRIATLDADHAWISDHDGGMIIPGLAIVAKAGMTWLLSLALLAAAARRRRITGSTHAPGGRD